VLLIAAFDLGSNDPPIIAIGLCDQLLYRTFDQLDLVTSSDDLLRDASICMLVGLAPLTMNR
jgi:hypothetical protein